MRHRYVGYKVDGRTSDASDTGGMEEIWMAFFSLSQSILLASFAGILAAHRSEILEKPSTLLVDNETETVGTYDAPSNLT